MINPMNPMLNGSPQMNNPFGNVQQLMQQFNQFRQSFQGNPQDQIQQLMNSGKVTQENYNWAYQQAQQFQKMMGGK